MFSFESKLIVKLGVSFSSVAPSVSYFCPIGTLNAIFLDLIQELIRKSLIVFLLCLNSCALSLDPFSACNLGKTRDSNLFLTDNSFNTASSIFIILNISLKWGTVDITSRMLNEVFTVSYRLIHSSLYVLSLINLRRLNGLSTL
jgi:hypothetical protein